METIIVTNHPKRWHFLKSTVRVIDVLDYLTASEFTPSQPLRVINLTNSYRYQSSGYYVSLLAEARNHKVLPSVTTIQDIKNPALAKIISLEIEEEIQSSLKDIKSTEFILSVYFGKNIAKRHERLCQCLHSLFPSPLFRVYFYHNTKRWLIKNITPISFHDIPEEHFNYLAEFAKVYIHKKRFHAAKLAAKPYSLAILIDPNEKVSPSNKGALKLFAKAANKQGFSVDFITKDDFRFTSEYDALFIRETTSVNHHTYRFARRAIAEGIIVIDDPTSILKCTNKVYLFELLKHNKIAIPNTVILTKKTVSKQISSLTFPCVLKLPDSAFSQGVKKVNDLDELMQTTTRFFEESDIIITQEFLPTEFDWRIGVLDNQPLFACRYYMAKDHWQIMNWDGRSKNPQEGGFDAAPIPQVPPKVIKAALKATALIGDGLYGVDVKFTNDQAYIIEINDNPNIDHGVEDLVLGEELYARIAKSFLQRIKSRHGYEG